MNFSLDPLSTTDFPSYTSFGTSPEERANLIEKEAYDEAKNLPVDKQDEYKVMVRRSIGKIRSQIAELRAQGKIEYAIHRVLDGLKQDFYQTKASFIEKNAQYGRDKALAACRNQVIGKGLEQCTSKFRPITRVPIDEEKKEEDKKSALPSEKITPLSERKISLEERKVRVVQCMQADDSALSLCAAPLIKDLSHEEASEVLWAGQRATVGREVNGFVAPLAAVSTAVKEVFGAALHVANESMMHHFCLTTDPGNSEKCLSQLHDAFEGKNPEVNQAAKEAYQAVKEVLPQWAVQTGEFLGKINTSLHHFDDYMAATYYTQPGLIHAGAEGVFDIGLAVAGSAVVTAGKRAWTAGAKPLIQAFKEGAEARKFTKAFSNPAQSIPKPFGRPIDSWEAHEALAIRSLFTRFIKDEAGKVKIPEFSKLVRERSFYVKLFESIGYDIVKGGKGSHTKMINRDLPHLPLVIIPKDRELSPGVARNLRRIYEKAIDIYQEIPSTKLMNFWKDEAGSVRNPLVGRLQLARISEPKIVSQQVLVTKPLPHRIDYSLDYLLAEKEFIHPREFNGVLSKDLFIVQYHSSEPLHQTRTYQWFMPVIQGNHCHTLEDVHNVIAKLSRWGEISEVSVAKVPAGEPVRFLHGRAKEQLDAASGELRPGGGVQYRFYDFDPKWVLQTRRVPESKKSITHFSKDESNPIRLPPETSQPQEKGTKEIVKTYKTGPEVLLPEAEEQATQRFYEQVARKREIADREKTRQINDESRKRQEELREEKRRLGILNLGTTFASKQRSLQAAKIDQALLQSCQPISLPNNFPKNFDDFFGQAKNIIIKNEIIPKTVLMKEYGTQVTSYKVTYQTIGKDILFFFKGTKRLESFETVFNEVCHFAEKKNYNRIFLTWDPLTHSLASPINKLTPIIGAGKLSRGDFKPFELIEVGMGIQSRSEVATTESIRLIEDGTGILQ